MNDECKNCAPLPVEVIEHENARLTANNPYWPGGIIRHFKTPGTNGFYTIDALGTCTQTGRMKVYYSKMVDPFEKYDRFLAEFHTDVSEHPENQTGQTKRFELIGREDIAITLKV